MLSALEPTFGYPLQDMMGEDPRLFIQQPQSILNKHFFLGSIDVWLGGSNWQAGFVTVVGYKQWNSIVTAVDGLAKSIYSTVLTDLGQSVDSNIFANQTTFLAFTNQTVAYAASLDRDPRPAYFVSWIDNTTIFFDYYRAAVPTGVAPSTISQQYLCQVPQRKSTGSLLVSIIVADLVFLQVLWETLNFLVGLVMARRHPESKYCMGCEKQLQEADYDTLNASSTSLVRGKGSVVSSIEVTSLEDRDAGFRRRSAFAEEQMVPLRTATV